jgi:hypothetical protein
MLPEIGMRINAGPEDFIEVDLEAGLKSSIVPVERRYLRNCYRVVIVKS